jgi:Ca2+-binding RTX toxin-like protein
VGNSGNNILSGVGGADVLYGKGGDDSLDAGVDAVEDQFVFDTTLNAATNVDTLFNAQFGEDQIRLDNDIFGALLSNGGTDEGTLSASYYFEGTGVGGGATADIGIWYNVSNGRLYYNPTDNVANDNILFAVVDGATPTLSNADFTLFTDVG